MTVTDVDKHVAARSELPSRRTPSGSNPWTWLREKSICDAARAKSSASNHWIVHGKVYDLSDFIHQHPGGSTWLELTRGQDITEAFEAHHLNSAKAEATLKTMYVRDADPDYVGRYVWSDNGFYRTLKRRVADHFKVKPQQQLPDTGPTQSFLYLCVFAIALHLSVFAIAVWRGSLAWAIAAGLTLQTFHGIGHNALHRKDNIWMYAYDFCGWKHHIHRISHAIAHHLHPNTGLDLEHPEPGSFVFTANADQNTPWVIFLGPWNMWSGPLRCIFQLWYGLCSGAEPWRPEYVLNMLQLVFFVAGGGVLRGFLCFCVMHFVCGFCIESAGFGLHRSVFCWTVGDANAKVDFGEHCLAATADHDVDISLFESLFLYQVLNNHGIHHLFPTIDKSRIVEIMPVFRQTCREFGIPWQNLQWRDIFLSLWKTWFKGLYGADCAPMLTTPPRGHLPPLSLTVEPIAGQSLGAIIRGVQVNKLSKREFKTIEQAAIKYGVVVLRDQQLTPGEQVEFALRFPHNQMCDLRQLCGPLAKDGFDAEEWRKFKLPEHPEIQLRGYKELRDHYGVNGYLDTRKGAREFHSDSCHEYSTPPIFTTLHCIDTPGRDETLFLDACLAYNLLSDDEKERAEQLFVQYTREPIPCHESGLCGDVSGHADVTSLGKIYGTAVANQTTGERKVSQVHPLVWMHPNTGRKAVVVAGMWMYRLIHKDGTAWTPEESHQYVLDILLPASKSIYAHQWQKNDLVLFDNRSLLHSASAALTNKGDRLLHQIIMSGDQIPMGPAGSGVNNPTVNPNVVANESLPQAPKLIG
eukprot:CAMPEP_0202727132 /NCGR_PEP_ID=MMETSP1385-20130828/184966_1 /ASSEMBLY_ACC=CAM_ASM_000861 /TAXON_ID=933848 /ORGANISM="Elphidium margaritaceum" /LENGTH=805 /DNA_ID=CAMNT_0049393371 /DNA_START=38 /DNA_END=2455 /DNA_ORIENTATION=+